jgi:hypothetical protein
MPVIDTAKFEKDWVKIITTENFEIFLEAIKRYIEIK